MANYLSIQGSVTFQAPQNGVNVNENLNLVTTSAPNGTTMCKLISAVTNSAALITLPNVATPGYIVLRNLDGTNSITYGPNTTAQIATLLPGALNIFSPTGTTLAAATSAGTAQLQIFAISS
jgi:hypothetical protein